MANAVPNFMNIDTIPQITETGLDGDPTCWFIVYVTGTGWCKIDAADVADIV